MRIAGIVIVSIIVVAAIIGAVWLWWITSLFDPEYTQVELRSERLSESLFIKKKVWGLLGDDQLTVITQSPNPEFEPDSTTDYVFYGLSPFLYRFENDTLVLFVRKSSTRPDHMTSGITVRQITISNPEMMHLMGNLTEKGLQEF